MQLTLLLKTSVDVEGVRVFLDILAGFNFHLSLCIKFHLDYSD